MHAHCDSETDKCECAPGILQIGGQIQNRFITAAFISTDSKSAKGTDDLIVFL